MKLQEYQTPKTDEYLKRGEEAVQELLGLLAQIKSDKEASIAHFDEKIRVTKENLRKCGHELKEAAPSSKVKTVKLKDDQIKSGLQRILSGKKDGMSIPEIMKELQITRGRFENFYENNTNFLGKRGEKRARVYFLL